VRYSFYKGTTTLQYGTTPPSFAAKSPTGYPAYKLYHFRPEPASGKKGDYFSPDGFNKGLYNKTDKLNLGTYDSDIPSVFPSSHNHRPSQRESNKSSGLSNLPRTGNKPAAFGFCGWEGAIFSGAHSLGSVAAP
jgi:hypothetical protein